MLRWSSALVMSVLVTAASFGCSDELPLLPDSGAQKDGATLDGDPGVDVGPRPDGARPFDVGPSPDLPPGACFDNGDCLDSEYCQLDGGCSGPGSCVGRPMDCPAMEAPICGCDGQTYGNACTAQSAGVNVADFGGPCPIKECRDNSGCDSDQFCNLDYQCDATNTPGACQPRPTGCQDVYAPVCGCDGTTYDNGCEAHAVAVSIRHDGDCAIVDCQQLETDYAQLLAAAKNCAGASGGGPLACDQRVPSSLLCQCETYVASAHTAVLTEMEQLLTAWKDAGCGDNGPVCDCLPLTGGACQALPGAATCVDYTF